MFNHVSSDATFGVEIEPDEVRACWSAARGLLDQTGRWPVASIAWSDRPSIDLTRLGQPDTAAGGRALAEIRACIAQQFPVEPFTERLTFQLNATRHRCGVAPDESEVRRSLPPDAPNVALERWLMDWEDANFPGLGAPDTTYLEWSFPPDTLLMFPPTAAGPQTLAYHGFWAEESVPGATPELLIAILDYWQTRYGAELVASLGTILDFVVARPPETIDEAWELALDHGMLAPDTFYRAGVPARDHARALIGRRSWFLHNRP